MLFSLSLFNNLSGDFINVSCIKVEIQLTLTLAQEARAWKKASGKVSNQACFKSGLFSLGYKVER